MCRRYSKALCALLLVLLLGLGLTRHGVEAGDMAMPEGADIGVAACCLEPADAHGLGDAACTAMCMIAAAAVLPTDFLAAPVHRVAGAEAGLPPLTAVPTPPDPFPPRPTAEA